MRVLAKPELDNAVILNEFVMIMENFGVMDHMDDEDNDDYISDTQHSILQSIDQDEESKEKEGSKKEEAKTATKDSSEKKNEADNEDDKKQNDKASKDIEKEKEIEEEKKATSPQEEEKDKAKEGEAANNKSKRKPRQHNLANIDAKGIKILRKLARFLLKQFLHPREFFGKAVTKEHIKTKKREFFVDVMKFKQFYLLIKIANIRKRLTENESLNKEICLDKISNKELINVKLLVKALEELAEEEQKSLIEEEKEAAEKLAKEKATNEESKITLGCSDVDTPRSESDLKQQSEEDSA